MSLQKFVCVDNRNGNGFIYDLTIDKIYDCLSYNEGSVLIKDDVDDIIWYHINLFKTLIEIRDDKLKKLIG